MKMTSSLKLKPNADFQFGKELIISKLVITQAVYNSHYEKFRNSFPNDPVEITKQKVNNLVMKEYVIGAIFDHLIPLFDFKIDKAELEKNVNTFKTNTKNLNVDAKENAIIFNYIDRLLKQQLVIHYFVNHFEKKLYPSKEEAITILENYYKETNKSIRELKTEPGMSVIQDTICQERFIEWIQTKYAIKLQLPDQNPSNAKITK